MLRGSWVALGFIWCKFIPMPQTSSSNYRIRFPQRWRHSLCKQTGSCLHLPPGSEEQNDYHLQMLCSSRRVFKKMKSCCFRINEVGAPVCLTNTRRRAPSLIVWHLSVWKCSMSYCVALEYISHGNFLLSALLACPF